MECHKDPYLDPFYSYYNNINDFSKQSDLLFSMLFADDTSLFIEGTAYSSMINDMNRELEKVDKWLNQTN